MFTWKNQDAVPTVWTALYYTEKCLRNETLTPLSATGIQYFTTVSSLHTGTEAVSTGTTDFTRLECSFHDCKTPAWLKFFKLLTDNNVCYK